MQLSRPGHFHSKNKEKLDSVESSEEEEDRMLSRVAFRPVPTHADDLGRGRRCV